MKKRERITVLDLVTWGLYLATLIGFGYMYYGLGHPPLTEADGMQWRPIGGAGALQGAKAADGTILIPQEYDEVKYHPNRFFGGHFTVQRGDTVACFDRQGRCLIPLERGYTHIRLTGDFDPWFEVVLRRGGVFLFQGWHDSRFQTLHDVPPGFFDDYL